MNNRKYSKYPQLAENIRSLRKAKSLNQESLAKELGVSKQAVSSWESGFSDPRSGALDRICDYFGVSQDRMCYVKIDYYITTDKGEPVLIEHINEEPSKTDNQRNRLNYYAQAIGNSSMLDNAVFGMLCKILPQKDYYISLPEQSNKPISDFIVNVKNSLIKQWWIDRYMTNSNYTPKETAEQLLGHALMLNIPQDVQYSIILFDKSLYDSFLQFKERPLKLNFELSVILIDTEQWNVKDQIFISHVDEYDISGDEKGLYL